MNTFYTHLQPNIVKFSDNEELPENIRCRYAINYNVWGIEYFHENYLLQESDDGAYLFVTENGLGNILLEFSGNSEDIIDIPRLYIMITDEFLNGESKFMEFIYQASRQNSIYSNGIPGFRPGKEYYLNETLFNYLANSGQVQYDNPEDEEYGPTDEYDPLSFRLPNYLDYRANISKYFVNLGDELIKDYTNLEYFNQKNALLNNRFSEDELNNFYQTFCQTILKYTTIKNTDLMVKPINTIYDLVLNYFANSMSDEASLALNLILNTNYNTVTINSIQNCGCQTKSSLDGTTVGNNPTVIESCSNIYHQAMLIYLKQMLGDTEFYEDWFTILLSEDDRVPNDVLIENLQVLLKEFMALDYDLNFTSSTNRILRCDCKTNNISSSNSPAEYKKLNNYLSVLDWINNCLIDENSNRIKVYGEAFGELLPKLQF